MAELTQAIRAKLIDNIIYYSGDEFETKGDVVELVSESDEQLINRIIDLLDYYYDEYDKAQISQP
jgi:hypothetical protein